MDVPVNGLKVFHRKGTKFVLLPGASQQEGYPLYAQVRKLLGKDLGLFLSHETQVQSLQDTDKKWEGLSEQQRQEAVSQSLAILRDIVLRSVLRVVEVREEETFAFTVTPSPIGEHTETEISIDCLESDYGVLVTEIRVLSFPPGGPNAGGSFRGERDLADSGLPGEAVRTTP